MKDNDKQDHVQTWEFWCDNTVHTKKYNHQYEKYSVHDVYYLLLFRKA